MTREEFLENEKKKREKSGKEENTTTKEARDEAKRINFLVNQELYRNPVDAYDSYTAGYSDAYSLGEKLANERNDILKTADENQLTNYYRAYLDGANRAVDNNDMVGYWTNQIMLDRISQKLGKATPTNFAKDIGSEFSQGVTGALTDIGSAAGYVGTSLTDQLDGEVLYNVAKSTNGNLQTTLDNYGWGKDNYERLQKLKDENPDDKYINMLYDTVTKQGYTGDKKTIETLAKYINEKNNKKRYDNWLSEKGIADFNAMRENQKIKEASRGYSGLSQLALDAAGVVGNMAPSIATGMVAGEIASGLQAANSVAQGVQQGAALAGMGASAFGGATTSAINRGADWSSAGEYGTLMAGIEVGTELIGGESVNALLFGKPLAKTALSPAISKLIEKGTSDATRFMIAAVTDIGSEAMEEMISAALEPFLNYVYLDEETSAKQYLGGILEGALGSIIPTLILGGLGKVETIQAVNKTQEELLSKIESYRGLGTELFPEEKLNEMAETVKLWSNRAKAGISEHYDEIKNETTNYNDAIGQMYLDLDIRPILSQDIAEYAMSLDIADPQEREQAIIDYAKERGINNEELRRMFPNYEEMFPYTTQQYRNYLGAFSNLAQSQGQVANQVNQGQNLGTIMGAFNSVQTEPSAVVPETTNVPESVEIETQQVEETPQPEVQEQQAEASVQQSEEAGTSKDVDTLAEFEKTKGAKREVRNGIDVVELPTDTDVYSGIQGFDENMTQDTLNNSPVYFTVYGKNSGHKYTYVYKNVKDMIKDWDKTYGGLTQIIGKGKGKSVYTVMSAAGKGEYYLERDKLALGGWKWIDANGNDVKGYQKNKRLQAMDEERKQKQEVFDKIEQKYGTKTTETIDGKTITHINIDKLGKKSPYWAYFLYDNPLVTNDGKQDDTINTGDLNWKPVVAVVYENGEKTGKAFWNVHDLKIWLKEHGGGKNLIIARNTSGSSYSLALEYDELVWRSDFDGKRVRPEIGPTIIEEAQGDYKTALKNPGKSVRHVDVRGKTFSNAAEFANAMQDTIDPLGETERIVFTKKVGDKEEILGVEETSYNIHASTNKSNYPNRFGSLLYEYGSFIARKAKALGADYVYEVHNHPGTSEPSGEYGGDSDLGASTDFKKMISHGIQLEGYDFKYGGGLVIGYDGYSFYGGGNRKGFKPTTKKIGYYTNRGSLANKDEFVQVPYENGYKYNGFKKEPWIDKKVNLSTLKEFANEIPGQKGYSKVVLTDLDRKPMYIGNIKDSALLQSAEKVNPLMYELSRNYGGGEVWVYSTNQAVLDNMKKKNMLIFGIDGIGTEYLKSPNRLMAYYEPRGGPNGRHSTVKWYTPRDEVIDDEDFIARDTKPAKEETKKEPRRRLAKKGAEEFASKVIEQYNQPSTETEDMMDIIPTDIELMNGADDLEQQIREIESGKKERELNRARNGIHDMRRYINKINFARTGLLKGPASRAAFGIWKSKTHWLRVAQRSNISTWFHEWGHEINSSGLDMKALEKAMAKTPAIRDELNKLCEERYGNRYDKKPEKKLGEGFAEAIRRYILSPERFADNFTNVATMFVNEAENNKNFAEMLAHMKVLSEMVKDYINDTGSGRVMSNIDMHGRGEDPVYVENTLQRFLTRITEDIFNDMVYLTKLDRAKAKGLRVKYSDLLSSEKIEDTLRLKGNAQRILTQLGRGMYDDYGNKITTGLSEIMEDFLPTKEEAKAMGKTLNEAINSRVEDLVKYGVALRELSLIQNRDLMMGTRLEDLKSTVEEYKKDAKLNQAIKQINENSQALIKLSVEKGLISAETGKQILRDNLMYFPLNRVMEDRLSTTLGNSRDGSTGKAYYQVKGSDLQISNPLISLMNNWGRVMYQIEHNDMLKTLVDFSKDVDTIGDWIDIGVAPDMEHRGQVSMEVFKNAFEKELGDTAKHLKINIPVDKVIDNMNFDEVYNLFIPSKGDASQRMLTYIDKGVRKTIQFANNDLGNGLYRMLTNMDIQKNSKLLNLINAINMPLKVGATAWNVEFALSNMQSDALQRFLYSNGTAFYIPLITSMYNVAKYMNGRYSGSLPWDTKTVGELYEKFLRSGASQEGTFRGEQLWLRDHVKDVFGYAEDVLFGKEKIKTFDDFKRKFDIKKANIAEKLNYVSEISEQATRFAEFSMVYNQMKAKGFSEAVAIREAGMKARQVTQDFTVQGRLMREINKIVPFASATVGGLYRFGQEARNHPVRLTGRLAVLAGLAMFLEGLMDGEDRKYYEEINKKKRFDNFFIPNPDDPQHPFIIKKPQGPARYLLNFAQLMTNVSLGRIKEEDVTKEFYDWLAMSVDDQMPVSKATDVLPPVFQAIIENNMNKDFYYGTPIVSKDLEKLDPRHQYDEYTSEVAKAIGNAFNWSPAKVDNIIKTWTAGFGKQILDAIDIAVRGPQDNEAPDKDQSEMLGLSKVYGNAFRSSESINQVYDRLEYLETEEAEGRITEAETREHARLQEAKSALSQINKQLNATRENTKLNSAEKAEKMDQLREERIDTARYYLGKTLLNNSNLSKIEKIAYYPANDTYSYTNKSDKKKYEVTFDEKLKDQYATKFQKKYEEELEKLRNTAAYKQSTEQEKLELEKKTKTSARTETTNEMKEIAYKQQYKN